MDHHSILYEVRGEIRQIGPYDSEDRAMRAARTSQRDGEFDIADQQVYHMTPDHRLIRLSMDDLNLDPESDG